MAKKEIKEEHKTKPVFLLLDEPVVSIDKDILNLRPFADVIAGAALGTKGPFTIGVYADWGEGKTSVLRLAKELIEENDKDIVTVWFNAWQYGKEDHPIVPLVSTIAKSVSDKLETVSKDEERTKFRNGLSKMSMALRAIAYGFSAKGKVSVPGFGELEAGFVAKEMIERYDQLSKGDDPLIEKTLYYNAFETLEAISRQIDDKIETPKIAVFIDDLDRCNPPEAIKLLESIKLVLSQKGFIFTLALDQKILQGFLRYRYEEEFKVSDYGAGGKDYLDKIIQLPLPLLPHEKRFSDYIKKLLDSNEALNHASNKPVKDVIDQLKEVLSKGARFNPRNLVRFLNNLIVDRLLWESRPDAVVEEADIKIMGLCVISRILRDHFKNERLYEYLWRNQDVCDRVLKFVKREKETDKKDVSAEAKGGREELGRTGKVEQIILKLREMDFLQEVLKTEQGIDWLKNKTDRESVNQFIVEQRKEEEQVEEELQDDEKIFDDEIRRLVNRQEGALNDKHYADITGLDLSGKGLKRLPKRIGKLVNLKELDLSGNKLTEVPAELSKLTNLTVLGLNGNKLTKVPAELSKLTNLRLLHLSANGLPELPAEIGELVNLTGLGLSGNQLTELPVEIGKLVNLKELDLSGNKLTEVPAELSKLVNLTHLYLDNNQLTELPAELSKLVNLTGLGLDNNQLTEVPAEIGKLVNLTGLYLYNNQLTKLPPEIGKLVGLKELYLTNNQLTTLPAEIGELVNLTGLWLNNNELNKLGDEIGKLEKLEFLNISGNEKITKEQVEALRRKLPGCEIVF